MMLTPKPRKDPTAEVDWQAVMNTAYGTWVTTNTADNVRKVEWKPTVAQQNALNDGGLDHDVLLGWDTDSSTDTPGSLK